MKKFLSAIGAIFGIAILAQIIGVSFAAPFPIGVGGTGTSIAPASGTVLIGNGAGSYTPALLTPGSNIVISTASGSVTIAVNGSAFLPSSTVYVASVNGQTGAVTITSSSLGVATNTLSLFNGNGFTTTTIQAVLNKLSASGLLTYNSSTGAFGFTSSSLNLGSASNYNFSDFLPSSTVYVATTTGNWQGTWKLNNPSDFLSSSTVVNTPSTTIPVTFVKTLNGSSGTYNLYVQGVGISIATGTASTTITWTNPGYITSVPATSTIAASGTTLTGPAFTFGSTTIIQPYASGSSFYWAFINPGYITTSTYNASMTITTAAPLGGGGQLSNNGYLNLTCSGCSGGGVTTTIAVASGTAVNGPNFILSTSTGIQITNVNSNFTIANTGVTSVNGSTGAVNGVVASATAINGATGNGFTFASSGPLFANIAGTGSTVTFTTISTSTLAGSNYLNLGQYLTAALTSINGDTTAAQKITGSGFVTTSTAAGVTTIGLKSNVASTTISITNWDATTTGQYGFFMITAGDFGLTLDNISCHNVAATTTYNFIDTTSSVNTTGQTVATSTCGTTSNTIGSTAFTTTTIPAGTFLIGVVSSTAGTPTRDEIRIHGFKT